MSDTLASVKVLAHYLLVAKFAAVSMGMLIVYDFLLTLSDEVSHVWGRKKSWIFYLFTTNRYLLLFYAILTQYAATVKSGEAQCTGTIFTLTVLTIFFLFSSDLFVALRVYVVTRQNKFIGLYLSALICAKVVANFYFLSQVRPNTPKLPEIPIEAFTECVSSAPPILQIIPNAIGVLFDVSAFSIIIWFAHSTIKNSRSRSPSLMRTIVADATVYFIIVMADQVIVMLFLSSPNPATRQFPTSFYVVLTPVLINRAVLSIKKAADLDTQALSMVHFKSTIAIEHNSPAVASEIPTRQPPEGSMEARVDTSDHDSVPLDELVFDQRTGLWSSAECSPATSQNAV